ncbi:MAG: hypothetical protein ACREIL_00260 [Nitrospiraceae bacterium]
MILALLLSPVSWVQHLVLMVPALYLILVEAWRGGGLGRPARLALWAYVVFALVLNRELVGRETYLVLLGYGTYTLCMLLVLGLLMVRHGTAMTGTLSQKGPAARRVLEQASKGAVTP